jgi:hypothetical protein
LRRRSQADAGLQNDTQGELAMPRDRIAEVEALDAELRTERLRREKSTGDRQNKLLRERITALEAELAACQQIEEVDTFTIPKHAHEDSEATAVVLASDWHAEERITAGTVNGLNRFTLAIAHDRINRFFVNVARLINGKQRATKIKTLILALLGDFISGHIHDELMETAQLPPIEAIQWVQARIASGIEYLLAETDVAIELPCHSGNHARTTKKVRHSTERGHSLEYFMYGALAMQFRGNERLRFHIAPGYHSIAKVGKFVIRFHHGHNVRYGGGVGGITIPMRKAISQWNKSGPVALNCCGHFHQLMCGGDFIVNGSLIGFSPYALSIKADYERPQQAFFLVHHQLRTLFDFCPVWVD